MSAEHQLTFILNLFRPMQVIQNHSKTELTGWIHYHPPPPPTYHIAPHLHGGWHVRSPIRGGACRRPFSHLKKGTGNTSLMTKLGQTNSQVKILKENLCRAPRKVNQALYRKQRQREDKVHFKIRRKIQTELCRENQETLNWKTCECSEHGKRGCSRSLFKKSIKNSSTLQKY